MAKTSINLHDDDIEFAKNKGSNLSDGIRYCINYCRDMEIFRNELKQILNNFSPTLPVNDNGLKQKILTLMDED